MAKRALFLAIPMALLLGMGILRADQNSLPGLVQLEDKSGRLCGTPLIVGQEKLLLENTRRISPDLPAALAKESQTQHEVGDTLSFITINFQSYTYETIRAVCQKKSERTYIFVGVEDLIADRVSIDDVDDFYVAFELKTPAASMDPNKGIRPLVTGYFGDPPNRSGDGYVYILIHDIKDNYDPAQGKRVYIAGYFSPTDQTTGTYSNRKDLINVDCYPQKPSQEGALATVAHEFQHLIHSGQDPDEDSGGLWVNEGASEYSEVLCGYSLRMPTYYLRHPERSLIDFNALDENLWDYQKVALWTYYLAEKFGPELIGEIVKEPKNSIDGVRSALIKRGVTLSFEDIFANFAIANYADDPALGENGSYSYNKIRLPSLPAVTAHSVYPLGEQSTGLPRYSMGYFRFTGEDSTANLLLQGQPGSELRARIYESGTTGVVRPLALDATNFCRYPLKAIGRSADAAVLTAISLGSYNNFAYSVSSDLRDNAAPYILAGPQELVPTGRSITISWQTDESASSIVEYGPTAAYGSSRSDTAFTTDHSVTLSGLSANTAYHYRVGSTDVYGNGPRYSADFQFTTSGALDLTVVTLDQSHSFAYSGRSLARAPDGVLHLLYHQVEGSRRFIYHQMSTDDGATWSEAVRLDETLFHSGMASIAVDALGRLHAAWHARASAEEKLAIYYSRSGDSGQSWTAPVCISYSVDENDQLYAAIAVDPTNNPHVVWNIALYGDDYAGDVYYNHSVDGGLTWTGDKMISSGSGDRRCHVPIIDFSSAGEAWVVWVDGVFDQQTRNVWAARSSNYAAWSAPEKITSSGALYDRYPAMVIDDLSRVHLVYADNYTPGDIRIVYTRFENGAWQPAISVAQSASGNVSGPSLTCDPQGSLYLLYHDDQGTATLGRYAAAPWQSADLTALAKPLLASGDIYLSVSRNGEWLAGGNLSNDPEDNLYAETPRRVLPGRVDAIWMRVLSTTENQLRYLQVDTEPAASIQPLRIAATVPAANAVDVPYFKQAFSISVDFDQRVTADSLTAATFTVSGAAQGLITGLISYDPSLRRLRFQASQDLLPGDLITVRLKGTIPQEGGVGLDGNLNGMAEGSPADDYLWTFTIQGPDTKAPALTIGIAQNPVLTRHMDIYIFATEILAQAPALAVSGSSTALQRVPGETPMYKADYRLEQSGVLDIQASGQDLAGNIGQGQRAFSAQFIIAAAGGAITSSDGLLSLRIPAGSMRQDGFLTICGDAPDELQGGNVPPVYTVGPAELSLARTSELRLQLPAKAGKNYQLERQRSDGEWEALPGMMKDGALSAAVLATGKYRAVEITQALPAQFALHQNYPNPFRLGVENTTFVLALPLRQQVEVVIYNLLGERIRTLVQGILPAGRHTLRWDGRDAGQRQVASGVYFYRCITPGAALTRKMLILQ